MLLHDDGSLHSLFVVLSFLVVSFKIKRKKGRMKNKINVCRWIRLRVYMLMILCGQVYFSFSFLSLLMERAEST